MERIAYDAECYLGGCEIKKGDWVFFRKKTQPCCAVCAKNKYDDERPEPDEEEWEDDHDV